MTFIEAAIEVLRQAGRPIHVHELTERCIKANLLTHLGRAPEATMRTRLVQEAKKGDRSPLTQKGQDVFGLRSYAAPARAPAPAPEPEAEAEVEGAAAPEAAGEAGKKRRRGRRGGRGRKRGAAGAVETAGAVEVVEAAGEAPEAVELGTPEEAIVAARLAGEESPPPIDLEALNPVAPRRYPRIVDLPSEEILSEQYADELTEGGVAAPVEGEVIDAQTADEDRPMLAEIKETSGRDRRRHKGKEDRKGKRKEDRKDDRKEQRKEAQKEERAARPPQAQPQRQSQPHPQPHVPAPPPAAAPLVVGTPARAGDLAETALAILRSLNDPRPVHARQLAAMALKRKLLQGDPEELWRAIRSALAGDARARQARGLRILARHQGGGLFTLTTARLEGEVRGAEDHLAASWADLNRLTREALRRRAAKLPLVALEQLVRMYLAHAGVTGIERVKRHHETWYLSGQGRRGSRPLRLLIAVRAGAGDSGRDAVGELRAGVEAKQLDEGLLFAPGNLDEGGVRELAAPGAAVSAYTGDAFAEELAEKGVGVLRAHLTVAYLDIDLLGDLSEG